MVSRPAAGTVLTREAFARDWAPRLRRSALAADRRRDPAHATQLDLGDVLDLWTRSTGRCEVTGRPFTLDEFPQCLVKRPFAPSLDRIDSQKPHDRDNVRLVCVVVNFALGEWGEAPLRDVLGSMVAREPGRLVETAEALWERDMHVRIDEARRALSRVGGEGRAAQARRLAGLKASLTKGRAGLQAAAARARATLRAR